MADDVYVVIESNPRFGFARLQSESSGRLAHAELYVEHEDGSAERLQLGDRVRGRVRGQSLHEPAFIKRAAPPEELVTEVAALLEALGRFELQVPLPARQLAEEQWRSREAAQGVTHAALREVLHPQLTLLFDWEQAHPFEDPRLLSRVVEAVRRHIPEFKVESLAGEGEPPVFLLEPGALRIQGAAADWERPTPRYVALMEAINALLERRGAPVRWTRLQDDWLFGSPELARLLIGSGLLLGPAS